MVLATKKVKPTSTNAASRRRGGEHEAANPSQATRSSPMSKDLVRSFSTPVSIPTSHRAGLGERSPFGRAGTPGSFPVFAWRNVAHLRDARRPGGWEHSVG